MNAEKIIIELLTNIPQLRDDDNKLIATFWSKELTSSMESAKDFLVGFYSGKFTKPETIRRTRQRLQEVNPHLRGFKYQERQKYQKKWISEMQLVSPIEIQESLF